MLIHQISRELVTLEVETISLDQLLRQVVRAFYVLNGTIFYHGPSPKSTIHFVDCCSVTSKKARS